MSENASPEMWVVWSLDVWGNEADGYEVNDRARMGTIALDPYTKDGEVLKALEVAGFIRNAHLGALEDCDEALFYVNEASTGRPVLQVELDA